MPVYEYRCKNCLTVTDDIRPHALRDDFPACPECGSETERVYSTPVVNIIDRKVLRIPGRQPHLKTRKRSLGTNLGRIKPAEIAREMETLEERYGKDLDRAEAKENRRQEEAAREIKSIIEKA